MYYLFITCHAKYILKQHNYTKPKQTPVCGDFPKPLKDNTTYMIIWLFTKRQTHMHLSYLTNNKTQMCVYVNLHDQTAAHHTFVYYLISNLNTTCSIHNTTHNHPNNKHTYVYIYMYINTNYILS